MVRSHYRRSSGRKVFMECVSKFTLSRMDRAYNPPAPKLQAVSCAEAAPSGERTGEVLNARARNECDWLYFLRGYDRDRVGCFSRRVSPLEMAANPAVKGGASSHGCVAERGRTTTGLPETEAKIRQIQG